MAEQQCRARLHAGFAGGDARVAVHHAFDRRATDPAAQATVADPATQPDRYDAAPVAGGNLIRADDRDVRVLLRCERPQLVVFADVLSVAECAELIERSRHRLKRSTTVNPLTGHEDVIRNRTSEGVWYRRGEDALIARIERRIESLTNWPLENGEGLQVLHYDRSGEYSPHFDFFPPDQPGSAVHTAQGGQRVATLIMYLNDVADGGETVFPSASLSFAARAGGAVYLRYMNGQRQLDPSTLHGGAPVLAGDKWIMTKWMRERVRLRLGLANLIPLRFIPVRKANEVDVHPRQDRQWMDLLHGASRKGQAPRRGPWAWIQEGTEIVPCHTRIRVQTRARPQ